MIMLTRSSEGIFNPMRYTCCIYDYVHSFFEEDFYSNALYWYLFTFVIDQKLGWKLINTEVFELPFTLHKHRRLLFQEIQIN